MPAVLVILSLVFAVIGSIMLADGDILGIGLSAIAIVLIVMAQVVQTSDQHKEIVAILTGTWAANERKKHMEKEFERQKQEHLG